MPILASRSTLNHPLVLACLFGVAVAIFIVSRLLSRDGTTIAVHVKHYNHLNGLQCHFEIVPGSPVSGSCTQMDGKTE